MRLVVWQLHSSSKPTVHNVWAGGGVGVGGLWGFGGGPLILIQNIKGAIKIQLVLCIGVGGGT